MAKSVPSLGGLHRREMDIVAFVLQLLKVVRQMMANGRESDEVPVHVGWVFRGTLDRR